MAARLLDLLERARFMAVAGIAFSILFLVVVIYVALPAFVLPSHH